MAFRYLIYRNDYDNTIVRESLASSATGGTEQELLTDFIIPQIQPLYFYRVTGGTDVVQNPDQNIDAWLEQVAPPTGDDAVTYHIFTGYTATTDTRISGIESDIINISGDTAGKLDKTDFDTYSGLTDTRISDNENDITYISGVTDNKQDQLSASEGINVSQLANNVVELDLTAFTPIGGVNMTISGSSEAVINDLRTVSKGFEYGGDYGAQFSIRSLVDKGYVDSVAAGLDLKESVYVATTSGETDIDLTLGSFGGVIDGVTLLDGSRVLIKNQDTSKEDNGIYVYSTGSATFGRAIDFDNPNVTSGAFAFVETGTTNGGSGWVLVTQDPISVGTSELIFTQFSSTGSLTAGVGINITNGVINFDGASVAGDSITWSGTQLNIDISTGNTLGDALALKLDKTDFDTYTGATDTRITDIENDVTYISGVTDGKIDKVLTAVDGNVSIFNSNGELIDSGYDIAQLTGTTDGVSKGEFDTYTGATDTRITDIENDVTYISGITDNKLDKTNFDTYSGLTDTRITDIENDITYVSGITDNKLDIDIFTGYTGSTKSNEIQLIHTGGTNLNIVTPVGIFWDASDFIGSAYSWTSGSDITILDAGDYEISYNIPFNQTNTNNDISIGGNIILNNTTILNKTASAGWTSRVGAAGSVILSSVVVTLSANDILTLAVFRTARTGTATSSETGTILIKKKNTLQ